MANRKDKRGSKPGERGQTPHQRNDNAAALILRLASFGLPQQSIADFLDWTQGDPLALDLGGQGYSIDTLTRHYRPELDQAKAPAKDMLLHRMYAMAMMEGVPPGVTPDRAYAIAADKLMALLNIQHGIMPHQSHRHAGPNGGPIPISLIESVLTPEEIGQLASITAKLEAAAQQ